jgi:membrane protein
VRLAEEDKRGTIGSMSLLRRIGGRLWAAYQGFQEHEGTLSAAGVAYYVALSFFPLLLVLLAGLGWVLEWTAFGRAAQEELLIAIGQQVSPDLAQQVERMLKIVSAKAGTGGPIGFVVLLISAIAIFAQLDAAFDRIFKLPIDPHETWLHWFGSLLFQRLKALAMLLATGGFIILVAISSMILSAGLQMVSTAEAIGPWIAWVSSTWANMLLNLLAFTALYHALPKPYIRWSESLQGGVLAAIFWEVGRQALAAYLLRLNYPSAYGVVGSFLAVMLWAYYGALVILFAAEYVRVLREERINSHRTFP